MPESEACSDSGGHSWAEGRDKGRAVLSTLTKRGVNMAGVGVGETKAV